MLNETIDNAVAEEVVDPQPTEEVVEVVETESVDSEVAADTVEDKQPQTQEENSKYADVRRKAATEATDKFISDQYGESHGIHTKADFDKAMQKQKNEQLSESLKDGEVSSDDYYKQRKENDPDFKELQKNKSDNYTKNSIDELNAELKDLDIDINIKSLDDISKLDNVDKITQHIKDGKSLSEAYFLANKKSIIDKRAERVQADTLNKVAALEGASPGSLNNPGEDKAQSIYELSDADFKQMQEDVIMRRRK